MKQEYFLKQLEEELVVALGCTEPVAVAYAASLAKKEAGGGPVESIELQASVSIYKNALGVFIPGTKDMGAAMAAALGAVGGNPDLGLQVLRDIGEEHVIEARRLCADGLVTTHPAPGDSPPVFIEVKVKAKNHTGRAVIAWKHDLITELERDGQPTFVNDISHLQEMAAAITADDLREIWDFAVRVDLGRLDIIRQAMLLNDRISREGLTGEYGLEVGRSIAEAHQVTGTDIDRSRCSLSDYCAARTAAAADARMAGAPFPVMSNSGSGNQGLTATVCVTAASEYLESSEEALLRAQTLSQLVAIHVKKNYGRLSPLCGATAAAVGASAGVVMLLGGGLDQVIAAVQNMFGTLTGMICDGAKLGCALKVSVSIYAAVQAALVAMRGKEIAATDGVIESDVEETIRNMERISREGMTKMDDLLLNIMLNKQGGC
ncbi:MAG TPA: L-serine ammonia-lyase, iron-sulfur-dependent, subunit alpha [Bacillota bacterium]|nr:L-serine ammonia-lyase, iron-sulfur-dependent, subunit alpha [Bacillota bacterium]HQB80536.1 L-serine ammonia-lyase, iron-sulfur-dependent, subunit alpha [Bacillota bacterium]